MTRIIGHRGAAGIAPENTLEGIRAAVHEDVDGVEFDIWLTEDNVPMLMHMSLFHITGRFEFLPTLTAEEVQKVGEANDFIVPTLDDVLSFLEDYDIDIFIEIKRPGDAQPTVSVLKDHGFLDRATILSFLKGSLDEIAYQPIDTGLLTISASEIGIARANDANARYIVSNAFMTTETTVQRAQDNDLELGVWKVDSEFWIERIMGMEPSFIVTDRPDLARDHHP